MEIAVDKSMPYPLEPVWTTMRDKLPELIPYLPNVERVEVRERTEPSPGEVHLVNFWKAAKTEVPKLARPFIDQSKLNWIDTAEWIDSTWTCRWSIHVGFMADRVTCEGATRYVDQGDGTTRIIMKGDLDIRLKGMLPGLIARKAKPAVEGFVVKLIQPNFEKTIGALAKYLDAQSAG